MKLKELLEEIKHLPEDTEILFRLQDGCCGDYFEIDDPLIDDFDVKSKDYYLIFDFPATGQLDFLCSCRSSSAAQNAVAKMRNKK